MKKSDASAGSIVWLSTASAALAVALIVGLGFSYERQSRMAEVQAARREVLDDLAVLRSTLGGRLDANVDLVEGFAAALEAAPRIDAPSFDRAAVRLLAAGKEARAVSLAPGMRVSMVYPLQGNEAVIGRALRSHPPGVLGSGFVRGEGAIIGPVRLPHGEQTFLARAPIMRDDAVTGTPRFWGVVTAALVPERLYAESGLLDARDTLDLVLAREPEAGGAPEAFFGDPGVLSRDPEALTIPMAQGAWTLAATPAGGWPRPAANWWARALFGLVSVAVAGPLLAMSRIDASRRAKLELIRQREAELSRLSWRLEFALAASDVGVWDVDLASDELFWDDRAKAIFGQPGAAGPFGTEDWEGALHPDDRAWASAQADAAAKGDGKFATMYRVVLPDGAVRHIRDVATLYEGEDGVRRLVGLVWDVTADMEREAELQLRREEAEAATVAKSRFLAAMSHEIRTPMGGVLGILELMLADRLTPRQHERARIARASAEELLRLLNDVLDFSKLEAGKVQPAEEAVDVRGIVAEVVELMAAGAEQRGLAIGWTATDAVPARIVTDPMRLRQVLTNLVSNAAKFTEAGSVEVRLDYAPGAAEGAGRGADELVVEVADTGIGVPPAERERIFGHFEQADNSLTRRAGGSGLGLAISRRLVELLGGRIEALGRPGGGSVFRFTVRTRPAEETEGAGEPAEKPAPEPRLGGVAPMRVLVAEDNPTNQYLINAFLSAMGHSATTVGTGTEAVAAAAEGGFDVVLMDVQMPDMDGLAAARAIRRLPAPAGEVPIIALTANALPGDRELCLSQGMTDYLTKPLAATALRDALARAQARGAGARRGAA